MTVIDDDLRLLSASPWFDDAMALELITLKAHERPAGDIPRAMTARLASLERSGLLLRHGSSRRVVEPLRTELRQALYAENVDLYMSALRIFSEHAENGLSPQLRSIMGRHGSEINIRVLRVAADRDGDTDFNTLVDMVREATGDSERRDADVAANLLESYVFKRDRRVEFLRGLFLWLSGRRLQARVAFEVVLGDRRVDKAGAIAGHLVGVHTYESGDLEQAEILLVQAIQDLRSLGDIRGLIMTLTTLGRLKRDAFRNLGRRADLDAAVDALTEARNLCAEEKDPKLESNCQIALGQILMLAGRETEALRAAERAVSISASGEAAVAARSALAKIYSDLGRSGDSSLLLAEAAEIARRDAVADRSLAKLLNMTAASERRLGHLAEARRLARASIHVGQRLNDQRHIAHANHTLGSIYIDMASGGGLEVPERLRLLAEAESLLVDARRSLALLSNRAGVQLVDKTLGRLSETRSILDDGPADIARAERPSIEGRGPRELPRSPGTSGDGENL